MVKESRQVANSCSKPDKNGGQIKKEKSKIKSEHKTLLVVEAIKEY